MVNSRFHDCDNYKPKPIPLLKNKILLVEGKDECLFFKAFLKRIRLIDEIQIFDSGGVTNIKDRLTGIVKMSGFSRVNAIGIIRDADSDSSSSFLAVKNALRDLQLPCPGNSFEVTDTNPKICVFILPDDNTNGELEDLCLMSINDKNEMRCVDQYFGCLRENELDRARKPSKSKIHVYLASQEEMVSIGVAAAKGYWPLDSQVFSRIENCLTRLFS